MTNQNRLDDLKNKILHNQSLPLRETATNLVFGEGSSNAKIILIGEAPGRFEDLQGKPFIGRAGKLLDILFSEIDISRKNVYITSVIKYRPPKNRYPTPAEVKAFDPFLDEQIKIIKPKIIITLGRLALVKFLPLEKISNVHGKIIKLNWNKMDLTLIPMYHPAAALRNPTIKKQLEADFQSIKKNL